MIIASSAPGKEAIMKRNIFFALALMFAALLLVSAAPAYACDCGCDDKAKEQKAKPAPKSFDKPPAVGTKATCPVMGDEFTVKKDTPRSEYKGRHYAFCCPGCKPKFDANPEKYAK
jgi:YHS domain-containing protein